jgi:hypothetical protein
MLFQRRQIEYQISASASVFYGKAAVEKIPDLRARFPPITLLLRIFIQLCFVKEYVILNILYHTSPQFSAKIGLPWEARFQ